MTRFELSYGFGFMGGFMGGFMPTQGVMSDVTPAGPGPKTGFWIRPIWAWIA